jgi:mono/diheme cytochrome c family protein
VALAVLACAALTGCTQQMASQPAYRPLQASPLWGDGRASRPLVTGTIPRGELRNDQAFYTGRAIPEEQERAAGVLRGLPQPFTGFALAPGEEPPVENIPGQVPRTEDTLRRGQTNFNIFCSVCHDRAATGEGMIPQRGFTPPPSLHIDRLRKAPAGHFFHVITRGYGAMPSYATQIPPRDRWEIVAYLRALQALSADLPADQVPADLREALGKGETGKNGGQKGGAKK